MRKIREVFRVKFDGDNLKSGVSQACVYEPDINATYLDMADYYDTVAIPGRVRKAKEEVEVEVGVQMVKR